MEFNVKSILCMKPNKYQPILIAKLEQILRKDFLPNKKYGEQMYHGSTILEINMHADPYIM